MTDVWESAEHLQSFVEGRLLPKVHELRLPDQVRLSVLPLHELSVPEPAQILAT